jgi:L-fuconolactonase
MRIDSHQHFWLYDEQEFSWIADNALQRDFLPGDLLPELTSLGYQHTVAVQARESLLENKFLLDLAGQFPFIAGVVGWVDLFSELAEDELAAYSEHEKFVGVRLISQGQAIGYFENPGLLAGIKLLKRHEFTYDILVYSDQMVEAVEFARKFPDQMFILDHLGKPRIRDAERATWAESIRDMGKLDNVFCKFSGMVTEALPRWSEADLRYYAEIVLEAFGPKRVMIGSDWPVCLSRGAYAEIMGAQENLVASLSKDEQQEVLGGTAIRAYRLKT